MAPPRPRRLGIAPVDVETALTLCRAGAALGDAERAALARLVAEADRRLAWIELPPRRPHAARKRVPTR